MRVLLSLLCAVALLAAAEVENNYLLRGATVHPVSGPEISGGSVLILNGAIAEVGAKIVVPRDLVRKVKVVELKG
ncbi:MAG: hypothetical protein ACRD44_18905, partial [Bryobacteraceae bacterium]